MQKLPGGATAVVHSLQLPELGSVLTDEPDVAGRAMSEVRAHSVFCAPRQSSHLQAAICKPQPGKFAFDLPRRAGMTFLSLGLLSISNCCSYTPLLLLRCRTSHATTCKIIRAFLQHVRQLTL